MKILFLGDVVGISGCSKIMNNLLNQIIEVFKDQRFETISTVMSQLLQLRNNINWN